MYTAYVLSQDSRNQLMEKFPPKYHRVIAHHVTVEFGVPEGTELPPEADAKIVGYADSGDGIEALVVSINGSTQRPDGKHYHITWSLESEKYKPVDSNDLVGYGKYKLMLPIPINMNPEVLK